MRTDHGEFDLIKTQRYCDICAQGITLLLPLTMTLEECIDMCCEQMGAELLEITVIDTGRNGCCEGEYSYVY